MQQSRLTKAKLRWTEFTVSADNLGRWTMLELLFSLHFFESPATLSPFIVSNRPVMFSLQVNQQTTQLVSVRIHTRDATSVNHRSPEPTRHLVSSLVASRLYETYATSCTSSACRELEQSSRYSVPVPAGFRKFESGTSLDDILDTHGIVSRRNSCHRGTIYAMITSLCVNLVTTLSTHTWMRVDTHTHTHGNIRLYLIRLCHYSIAVTTCVNNSVLRWKPFNGSDALIPVYASS